MVIASSSSGAHGRDRRLGDQDPRDRGQEADPQHTRNDPGQRVEVVTGRRADVQADGGEGAPDPVPQVQQHGGQGDHVEQPDPPLLEAGHDASVRGGLHDGLGPQLRRSEVQDVRHDEEEDDDAAPAHRARRVRALHAAAVLARLVTLADAADGGPGLPGHHDRGHDVQHDSGEHHDTDDPEEATVGQDRLEHGAQVMRVGVIGFLARKELQVAVHVKEQEAHHEEACDCHHCLPHNSGARCSLLGCESCCRHGQYHRAPH
ncbi:hypothetical protein SDC9_89680 [bioreactor metagenome]|uniref:Uncharacterized protein n=1 Tax=bioreactor metagenome TaxID=1076179 RepID=A0A644ZRJ6_9ZZZZ